jgi:hypothetical protein
MYDRRIYDAQITGEVQQCEHRQLRREDMSLQFVWKDNKRANTQTSVSRLPERAQGIICDSGISPIFRPLSQRTFYVENRIFAEDYALPLCGSRNC